MFLVVDSNLQRLPYSEEVLRQVLLLPSLVGLLRLRLQVQFSAHLYLLSVEEQIRPLQQKQCLEANSSLQWLHHHLEEEVDHLPTPFLVHLHRQPLVLAKVVQEVFLVEVPQVAVDFLVVLVVQLVMLTLTKILLEEQVLRLALALLACSETRELHLPLDLQLKVQPLAVEAVVPFQLGQMLLLKDLGFNLARLQSHQLDLVQPQPLVLHLH